MQKLLIAAFPDRLCRRRSFGSDKARMVGGRGVKLSAESVVKESEFFLALDGVETGPGTETVVSLAAGVSKDLVLEELSARVEKKKDLSFDREKAQFYVREGRHFQDLPLEEGSISIASAQDVADHLPEVLSQEWDLVLKENDAFAAWVERWNYLIRARDKVASETARETLRAFAVLAAPFSPEQIHHAFAMAATGEKDFKTVMHKDLIYFFEQLLPSELAAFLRSEVPAKVQVPSGNSLRIFYPPDRDPYMEVRIQEVFGWTETPKILKGAQTVTLHLLGPNYRPMQVTSDLRSFWQNGYPEVRKELRTRYPKHSWPEDPLTAKAVAKGRSTKH